MQRAIEEKRKVLPSPLEKKRKELRKNPGVVRPLIQRGLGMNVPGR
jgi:hypothetical protein